MSIRFCRFIFRYQRFQSVDNPAPVSYTHLDVYKRQVLGFSREQIDDMVDDIITFADIGDHINQPVKTYSSGMFVRLAFAVAINVDPDILIVDEALAVGDLEFQLKCMEKFTEFRNSNKTILFVSHDINSIRRFCDRVYWLKNGEIVNEGDTMEVTEPVSYTHLDVYKRQVSERSPSTSSRPSRPKTAMFTTSSSNKSLMLSSLSSNCSPAIPCKMLKPYTAPVSYTHLDVYKRQIFKWLLLS